MQLRNTPQEGDIGEEYSKWCEGIFSAGLPIFEMVLAPPHRKFASHRLIRLRHALISQAFATDSQMPIAVLSTQCPRTSLGSLERYRFPLWLPTVTAHHFLVAKVMREQNTAPSRGEPGEFGSENENAPPAKI